MRIEPSGEPGHHDVTFTWRETDPDRPARSVVLRLVSHTEQAYDDGELGPYLMTAGPGGEWSLTLRLPSGLRSSYQLCPIRDQPLVGHPSPARWAEIMAAGTVDPDAATGLPAGTTYGNPGPASILELPDAPPQPWSARRPGVARGTVIRAEIGADGRPPALVHVHLPAGHRPGDPPTPLLVLFDGGAWRSLDLAATLDNLSADGAAPPMMAIAVESIHAATRPLGLTHPELFESFVLDELLPWAAARWSITDDPARTVLAGQSLGGLTVAHLAGRHPDRFGWVIGQSTASWWPGDADGGLSGAQVQADLVRAAAPVRFLLEVGTTEGELLSSVRVLRQALVDSGYDVRYREYEGGHDYACWRGGLADGLVTALGQSTPDRPLW